MRVICWDFDGTLVHSESHFVGSVYRALKEVDPETATTIEALGRIVADTYPWLAPEQDCTSLVGEKWWEFMNRKYYDSYLRCGVAPETARTASEKVRALLTDPANYALYEDTVEVLSGAREMGCVNVLVSNNYPELEKVMEALRIRSLFDGVLVSGVEGYNKPRRELFDLVRRRFSGDGYVMVGDNVIADVVGAKNAGMTGILVHRGNDERADYCFDDLRSVLNVIA